MLTHATGRRARPSGSCQRLMPTHTPSFRYFRTPTQTNCSLRLQISLEYKLDTTTKRSLNTTQIATTEAAFVGPLPQAAKGKRGRPAKHADAAARQRAYREANNVKTLRLDGKLAPTIAELAAQFDTTETHVVNNMLR